MVKFLAVTVAVVAAVFTLAGPARATDTFGARLHGFEEAATVPISTPGQGFLILTLNDAETQLDYQLFYTGLESNITQSHIHFGQKGISGGVILFFCTNLAAPAGVPAPPACPTGAGFQTVTGSLTAANIVAVAAQGIAAGEFAEVLRAIKAGMTYANIHTTGFGSGEIRGQITR